MKIAVDLDDTLSVVDRVKRTSAYIARKNLPFRLVNPDAHVLQEVYDWSEEDVGEFIREGGIAVFTDAPARSGARETLARWKEEGNEIIILTARRSDWFGNPVKVSGDWLEKRKIPYDEIVADVWEKGAYCLEHNVDILIEDNFDICLKAQDLGINAVLFVDKHNLSKARRIKYAGANWKQIANAVHYIMDSKEEE